MTNPKDGLVEDLKKALHHAQKNNQPEQANHNNPHQMLELTVIPAVFVFTVGLFTGLSVPRSGGHDGRTP